MTCWNYDRVAALLDGRVTIPGVELAVEVQYPTQIFASAFTEAPYDISELSASSYVMQLAKGACPYVALPAYLSRAFRHGGIYVRTDRGIAGPKDLEGRLVGVPEYQMTMALWARGLLADEYGVDTDRLRYRTGGLNQAGRKERLTLDLPARMDVAPVAEGRTLNELLVAGELDAVIAPAPPDAFVAGDARIARLFPDVRAAERDYYARTGIFPIMHLVGLRRELAEAQPGLARAVYDALLESRRLAMAELAATATASANRIQLPWLAAEWEDTRALMGVDYWPYGVERNRAALDALCRYSVAQHLAPERLSPDRLFHPETLD
ncbi:MAG: ABC transporter substrate-binding protein [Rhodospirillaceae bacterium]